MHGDLLHVKYLVGEIRVFADKKDLAGRQFYFSNALKTSPPHSVQCQQVALAGGPISSALSVNSV